MNSEQIAAAMKVSPWQTGVGCLLIVLGLPGFVFLIVVWIFAFVAAPFAVLSIVFEGTAIGRYADMFYVFLNKVIGVVCYSALSATDFLFPFESSLLTVSISAFLFILGVAALNGVFAPREQGYSLYPYSRLKTGRLLRRCMK